MDLLENYRPDSLVGIKPADGYGVPRLPGCSYSELMFRLKCVLTLNNARNDSTFFRYTYFPFLAWSLPLLFSLLPSSLHVSSLPLPSPWERNPRTWRYLTPSISLLGLLFFLFAEGV